MVRPPRFPDAGSFHSSTSVGVGVYHSISVFFSPEVATTPAAADADSANWLTTAIEATLASEAGEEIRACRREIDGLIRLASDEKAPTDSPAIGAARDEFCTAVEQFDAIKRRMDRASETANLPDWIRLGAAAQQVKKTKAKLARALATVAAPQ
jgi:hypothetical protein